MPKLKQKSEVPLLCRNRNSGIRSCANRVTTLFKYFISYLYFNLITDPLSMQQKFWFEKNQFYVMVMESALEKGQYLIKMEFKAWLTGDLAGLYKSTYKKKDGTSV